MYQDHISCTVKENLHIWLTHICGNVFHYYYTGIKKKLVALANKKENQVLQGWIRAILNHFWFSCSSCGESAEVITPMYKEFIKIALKSSQKIIK